MSYWILYKRKYALNWIWIPFSLFYSRDVWLIILRKCFQFSFLISLRIIKTDLQTHCFRGALRPCRGEYLLYVQFKLLSKLFYDDLVQRKLPQKWVWGSRVQWHRRGSSSPIRYPSTILKPKKQHFFCPLKRPLISKTNVCKVTCHKHEPGSSFDSTSQMFPSNLWKVRPQLKTPAPWRVCVDLVYILIHTPVCMYVLLEAAGAGWTSSSVTFGCLCFHYRVVSDAVGTFSEKNSKFMSDKCRIESAHVSGFAPVWVTR